MTMSMLENEIFVHKQALVESSSIGSGTRVWAFAHVMNGARVGRDCNICDHTFIEGGAVVGDRVTIKSGVFIWDGVTCEDDVFLGPSVVFTNDLYPRSRQYHDQYEKTLVRKGASLGANCTILAGITIGRYAMIGLGSVVTRSVPDFALCYGNPARAKGFVGRAGKPLIVTDEGVGVCPENGEKYRIEGGSCTPLDGADG